MYTLMKSFQIVIILIIVVETLSFRLQTSSNRLFPSIQQHQTNIKQVTKTIIASSFLFGLFSNNVLVSRAEEVETETVKSASSSSIPIVPLYKNKGTDLVKYADVARGFSLLRPFGYNGRYISRFNS